MINVEPMIYVGIDDTDTRDTPGTNKLAMYLAKLLGDAYETRWIIRHQLLEDPRVPCTNRNGCVSLELAPRAAANTDALIARLRDEIIRWVPAGSDPGLCVVERDPERFVAWGLRAQTELVEQHMALRVAADAGVYLEPLGGTGDGIIGALAAVGLLATWNSGRIIHCYRAAPGSLDLTGSVSAAELFRRGVQEIVCMETGTPVFEGEIDLGKRLRPNMRDHRIVLFVAQDEGRWIAQRVVS